MKHTIYDDDTPENIRGVIGWTVLLLAIGYACFNALLPNNDINIAVDVLIGTFASMALFYYIGAAARAIWVGSRANTDYLIVGICLSWLSQDGQAWLRVISRLSGFDLVFTNSELFGPVKLLSVIAAVMHVIPKGAANGVVPQADKRAVAWSFAIAAVIASLILVVKPDPRPLIKMMPNWSRDAFHTGSLPGTTTPPS